MNNGPDPRPVGYTLAGLYLLIPSIFKVLHSPTTRPATITHQQQSSTNPTEKPWSSDAQSLFELTRLQILEQCPTHTNQELTCLNLNFWHYAQPSAGQGTKPENGTVVEASVIGYTTTT